MNVRFTWYAGLHDRFAPGAFDRSIGEPFQFGDSTGTLIRAFVADDSRSVMLECDVPMISGLASTLSGGVSFSEM